MRYHQSRPYGWFGVADVDGDGQVELVTIGDFQSHIDVLNYDPKKSESQRLSVRWRRDIEQKIEERTKWPRIGPRPLVNATGDERLEIVLNLFNDTGDSQWHALVIDASTGKTLHDFPGRFLKGSADLDGDQREELFLIAADGVRVPTYGSIEMESLKHTKPAVLWSRPLAAWITADLPRLGSTWSTTASQSMQEAPIIKSPNGARPAFCVAEQGLDAESSYTVTLSALRLDGNGASAMNCLWSVAGFVGEFNLVAWAATSNSPPGMAATVRMNVPKGGVLAISCTNTDARVVASQPLSTTLSSPIIARLQTNGPMIVVSEGTAQQVFAIEPPKERSNEPRLLWRRTGRGMGDGSRRLGIVGADLDGNGGQEVIVADQDGTGRALLVAYRHDGSRLWQTAFKQTPGALPIWNAGALTFWWPGNFRSKNQSDLFVNTRRGLMHSDVGHLIDGRTGALIWRQEKATVPGQFSWAYAGAPPGIADLDRDGLDELVSLYPVCFWIADGRTGRLSYGVELASRKQLPAWAAYGEPMVFDFLNRNKPAVLLDSPYILALLETNGAPIWHGLARSDYPTGKPDDNVGQTTAVRHALVDIDGDGTFEIGSAGYVDGVRVFDSRNGKLLWSLKGPDPSCYRVTAADIDGRRGDELLYVSRNKLIAVTGNRSSGRILWEWEAAANLSMPAIADLDGDGLAEIVVQLADESIQCLDSE